MGGNSGKLLSLSICITIFFFTIGSSHALDLSPEYTVYWEYDGNNVTFEVIVATRGFIGFGLSPTGGMAGADIVIGGVTDGGAPYFMDYHGVGNSPPVVDDSQDWFLITAGENVTHTTLTFTREIETCDDNDWTISMDTQKIIWSWGSSDDVQYHGINRGTKLRNILDPTPTPPDLSQYKIWEMFNTITIPAQPTTYWCSIHKTPNFTGAHHMIGFDIFLPNDEAVRHTHHVDVYGCRADNPELIFEQWVGDEGRDCYLPDPNKPDFPAHHCDLIELGWVIGGEITLFPEHTGFPFEPNTYYMLEAHYDNPQSLDNLRYETGYKVYYTPELRVYDAGYLLVGSVVSYTHMIPPNSVNFTQVAHCSPWCTSNFPADGLHVFGFLFHAHTAATAMKVRLFRDGQEEPWILHDAHFDSNYQQNRMLREEFRLLQGDHLTVECLYDTTWKEGETTLGGRSTREEMCMAYFFYYPNLPEVAMCNSELPEEELLRFLGLESVELEGEWETDPIVRSPPEYAGLPLTTMIQGLNWTREMRDAYQTLHFYSPHEIECFPHFPHEERDKATYPPVPQWQPTHPCENN